MAIYNYSSKEIIEIEMQSGYLNEASITNSDLDTLCSNNIVWNKTELRDSNCNDSIFLQSKIIECDFSRSSLINSQFLNCTINNTKMHGLSFIKVKFEDSRIRNLVIDSCTMQRSVFSKSTIESTTIKDIEGLYSKFINTVFTNCFFELSYGNGMNGFSSAFFENCLFYNCNFIGYPLRGATTKGCTFVACSGEITDDIEAMCSYGLPINQPCSYKELEHYNQAINLIKEVSNV